MKKDPALTTAIMLTHYGFDLNGGSLPLVIKEWLDLYPNKWVLAAVVEALYQGRYKASSVNRILDNWCSRGKALPNFDHDFADYFCRKIVKALLAELELYENRKNVPELANQQPASSHRTASDSELERDLKFTKITTRKHSPNPNIAACAKLVSQL
ncbi:hypothetical protein [Halomicronema sp. CCY15110]|uniref:hypothetical protein n=1 Tax=Halomicronema sp. CCY15110 TaxID=2767773 RepID=UPI00194ECB2A|nr:hypothetical protein [Halomicronema sp. CCY15110]